MLDEYGKKIMDSVVGLQRCLWNNPNRKNFVNVSDNLEFKYEDIVDADKRLQRFAPLIKRLFSETVDGIIESELVEIPEMKRNIEETFKKKISGRIFLKCDNHLKVAGSIKARGGIYEVLKHAEYLAVTNGLLEMVDDYSKLADRAFHDFFSNF